MIGYGQPSTAEYGHQFLMKATLEDGFLIHGMAAANGTSR